MGKRRKSQKYSGRIHGGKYGKSGKPIVLTGKEASKARKRWDKIKKGK